MSFFTDSLIIAKNYFEFVKNAFGIRRKFQNNVRIDGKVVVITGGNTGIGKETAYQLTLRGAKVIIGCRDVERGGKAVQEIRGKNKKADIVVMKIDLSSFESIRHFARNIAEKESNIDILINNAGVMMCPKWTTEDGFEMQFGTNHLGHFLLTLSLMPLLKKSFKARVVNVSAALHVHGVINFDNINLNNGEYSPSKGYYQSKLANVLFTRELGQRLGTESNVNVYALHPGIIDTELQRNLPEIAKFILKYIFISTEMGVQTTLYCALEESLDNETGFYYDDCRRVDRMVSQSTDDKSSKRLWDMSCDLVKLEGHLRVDNNRKQKSFRQLTVESVQ